MATRDSSSVDHDTVELPHAIPLDVPELTRLPWERGSRALEDATLRSTWTDTETPWRLSMFRATDSTVLLRVRTPVGRERFYVALELDPEDAVSTLETAASWRRVD